MNRETVDQNATISPAAPQLDTAKLDPEEFGRLFGKWREDGCLGAAEENRFAHLLKALIADQADEIVETEAFLRVLRPFTAGDDLSEEERRDAIRHVKPLLRARLLTDAEKAELTQLFNRYRMRLWSKLHRNISAAVGSRFGPDDVLQEAYIRAMTRWPARPEAADHQYVWLYGIVHDQFRDMLRKEKAIKRGDLNKHKRIPDNSAAEIALRFWQSQTGASTSAARKEFVARLQSFLEGNLSPFDLEIFSMRVFDRLEYPEIVTELIRRAELFNHDGVHQEILDQLDSRPQDAAKPGPDLDRRRADAVRKRFKRAVAKLTAALLNEFPELLDAVPALQVEKA